MLNNSQDHSFQWTQYNNSHGSPDVKVETLSEPFSLLSPPLSPSIPLSSQRRRSTGSTSSPKRTRPYPLFPRNIRSRIDEMATTPAYWVSSSNARGSGSRAPTNERRASEGSQQLMYNTSQYSSMPAMPQMYGMRPSHRSPSTGSSGTSSLTGAMGETQMSSRHSGSPPPVRDPLFNMTMGQPIGWGQSTSMNTSEPTYGVPGPMPYVDQQAPYAYRSSPESLSPPSPFTTNFDDHSSPSYNPQNTPLTAQDAELRRLRKRVRELELANERAREQIKVFESGPSAAYRGALPSPVSTPPMNAAFQASWKARTEARIRQYCALNRAGNALCAWHDSRRERREYPPRMAPPGVLNCGCTYEEALFEESLARHNVGSYHPGDSVRMDPALRNPLLKLLQTRYGYRDGDFERNPQTGEWILGEGPAIWEQQLQAGASNPRRGGR